jgi:hypothetical protein
MYPASQFALEKYTNLKGVVMHGVEDVEEGTRYSAVCWMVGKFFK